MTFLEELGSVFLSEIIHILVRLGILFGLLEQVDIAYTTRQKCVYILHTGPRPRTVAQEHLLYFSENRCSCRKTCQKGQQSKVMFIDLQTANTIGLFFVFFTIYPKFKCNLMLGGK